MSSSPLALVIGYSSQDAVCFLVLPGFPGVFLLAYMHIHSHTVQLSRAFKRNQVSVRRSVGLSVRQSVRFLRRSSYSALQASKDRSSYEAQVAQSLHLTVFFVALLSPLLLGYA